MLKKILTKFKIFSLGIRRLLIAGVLVVPYILGVLLNVLTGMSVHADLFLIVIFFGIPAYIVLVYIAAWIVEGFKNKE